MSHGYETRMRKEMTTVFQKPTEAFLRVKRVLVPDESAASLSYEFALTC